MLCLTPRCRSPDFMCHSRISLGGRRICRRESRMNYRSNAQVQIRAQAISLPPIFPSAISSVCHAIVAYLTGQSGRLGPKAPKFHFVYRHNLCTGILSKHWGCQVRVGLCAICEVPEPVRGRWTAAFSNPIGRVAGQTKNVGQRQYIAPCRNLVQEPCGVPSAQDEKQEQR